jgi:hypothetical protein
MGALQMNLGLKLGFLGWVPASVSRFKGKGFVNENLAQSSRFRVSSFRVWDFRVL